MDKLSCQTGRSEAVRQQVSETYIPNGIQDQDGRTDSPAVVTFP
jgi:hypothetical protein